MIYLYTDGSSKGNPGPGGYGVLLKKGNLKKEISSGYRKTTNNRMELLAVIVGLEALKKTEDVLVVSDSKYVVDSVEKGWVLNWEKSGFKKKKNIDLWVRFLLVYRKHSVSFQWIKGHNNHPENERCDFLAVTAAEGSSLQIDKGFEDPEIKKTLFNE